MPDIDIVALDRVEIQFGEWLWPFAAERRGDIDRFFEGLRKARPGVWNGRALLLNRYAIEAGTLHGACFETDYASFCAWREWQFPDANIYNVFAAAALRGADGGWLVGEMGSDTVSAGQLYFPCGTPEPDDVGASGALDLAANLSRELAEETGLDMTDLAAAPGWTLVRDRCYFALLKHLTAPVSAEDLRARVMRYIGGQKRPELVDIHIVRGPAELNPRMPRFMSSFFEHAFER